MNLQLFVVKERRWIGTACYYISCWDTAYDTFFLKIPSSAGLLKLTILTYLILTTTAWCMAETRARLLTDSSLNELVYGLMPAVYRCLLAIPLIIISLAYHWWLYAFAVLGCLILNLRKERILMYERGIRLLYRLSIHESSGRKLSYE